MKERKKKERKKDRKKEMYVFNKLLRTEQDMTQGQLFSGV